MIKDWGEWTVGKLIYMIWRTGVNPRSYLQCADLSLWLNVDKFEKSLVFIRNLTIIQPHPYFSLEKKLNQLSSLITFFNFLDSWCMKI